MTICTIEALDLSVVFILFLSDPADEMAVRQRIFNSTSPFSGSSQAELKGSYPSCSAAEQEAEEEEEEGKDSKTGYTACLNPLIKKLLTHGTAEQVGEKPLKTSTFIAQAECNYVFLIYLIRHIIPVDLELTLCSPQVKPRIPKSLVPPAMNAPMSPPRTASPAGLTLLLYIASALDILCLFTQVILNYLTPCLVLTSLPSLCFSVTSEHNNVATTASSIQEPSSSSAQLAPGKRARKRQKRKGKKKLERKKERQRHRHRMPSGVPEQESGSSLVRILVRALVIITEFSRTWEKEIETDIKK